MAGSAVLLVGNKKSFLDLTLGMGREWRREDMGPVENRRLIIGNIGFRYLFESGFLRLGIGVPDIMYFSVGASF